MKRIVVLCIACFMLGTIAGQVWLNRADEQLAVAPAAAQVPVAAVESWTPETPAAPVAARMTQEEQNNIEVYQQANRSVVNVSTQTERIDHFFRMRSLAEGSGSGAVIDKQGHVVTNYHVVEGAKLIEVTLASNSTYAATLVGQDKESDIAVLRIDAPADELFPITNGTSDNLRVGQRTYVLGNPFGWDGTLTTGIISSLNRDLPSRVPGRTMQALIQTDAAMNPGNSGGPLLDTSARMIGMCVAIATKSGQNAGVGFAIPIDRIKQIVPELIENGRVIRADIGITHVMETENGLVIARLDPEGPAAQAGLRGFERVIERRRQGPVIYETPRIDRSKADRILAVDGEPMRSGVQFRDKIWQYNPGDQITLTIVRQNQQSEVTVVLGTD